MGTVSGPDHTRSTASTDQRRLISGKNRAASAAPARSGVSPTSCPSSSPAWSGSARRLDHASTIRGNSGAIPSRASPVRWSPYPSMVASSARIGSSLTGSCSLPSSPASPPACPPMASWRAAGSSICCRVSVIRDGSKVTVASKSPTSSMMRPRTQGMSRMARWATSWHAAHNLTWRRSNPWSAANPSTLGTTRYSRSLPRAGRPVSNWPRTRCAMNPTMVPACMPSTAGPIGASIAAIGLAGSVGPPPNLPASGSTAYPKLSWLSSAQTARSTGWIAPSDPVARAVTGSSRIVAAVPNSAYSSARFGSTGSAAPTRLLRTSSASRQFTGPGDWNSSKSLLKMLSSDVMGRAVAWRARSRTPGAPRHGSPRRWRRLRPPAS